MSAEAIEIYISVAEEIELQSRRRVEERRRKLDAMMQKVRREARIQMEVTAEADRVRKSKEAEAESYTIKAEGIAKAEAIKAAGLSEAEIIRAKGEAEAEIIKAKGEAEAIALAKKAEAYKLFNDAAIAQMVIEKLPEIASAIAQPLSKTEKIVMIGDSGASKITKDITNILAQLPETVKGLTGVDITNILKNYAAVKEDVKPEEKETS